MSVLPVFPAGSSDRVKYGYCRQLRRWSAGPRERVRPARRACFMGSEHHVFTPNCRSAFCEICAQRTNAISYLLTLTTPPQMRPIGAFIILNQTNGEQEILMSVSWGRGRERDSSVCDECTLPPKVWSSGSFCFQSRLRL